jgi:hypothetical protein
MKLDPGMHIGMHLVSFGKSGVTDEHVDQKVLRERASTSIITVTRER